MATDQERPEAASGNVITRFFRKLRRVIEYYLMAIGLCVTLLWVGVVLLISKSGDLAKLERQKSAAVLSKAKPAHLHLHLSGKLEEAEPDFTEELLSRFFRAEDEVHLPALRRALTRAAQDERVGELHVDVNQLAGTPVDYTEMRRLLETFRAKSGKPVEVSLADPDDWNYYVASAGSKILLDPASAMTLTGPAFHLVYFGDALRKLGIDIDVVRAGKYKSAFEPFIANQPSAPTLEEYNALQTSLADHIVGLVAKDRKHSEADVRSWYRRSLYTAPEAVKAGIVDALGYGEPESDDTVSMSDYMAIVRDEPDTTTKKGEGGAIALIEATGEINLTGKAGLNPGADDGIAPADIARQVRWALEESDAKAVVLRVSSPGGSAVASDMIWHELKRLADAKPLVVSMGTYAASGGYYISAPARYIVAEPTTITGSIGVIGMVPSAHGFEDKWGISFHVVSGSDRRAMLDLGSRATAEDKALLESSIDQVYQTFLQRVADGRKLKLDDVKALAQGRVYTGAQAKGLGLVDELGGITAAFKQAKKLAGLDPEKSYKLLRYEDSETDLSSCLHSRAKLMKCLRQGNSSLMETESTSKIALDAAGWLREHQGRALALWPGYLSVLQAP